MLHMTVVRTRARRASTLDTDVRQLYKDHVFGTFIEDQAGVRLLDILGEDKRDARVRLPALGLDVARDLLTREQVVGSPA